MRSLKKNLVLKSFIFILFFIKAPLCFPAIKYSLQSLNQTNFEEVEALLAYISLADPTSDTAQIFKEVRHEINGHYAFKISSLEQRLEEFKKEKNNPKWRGSAKAYGDPMGIFYLGLLKERYALAFNQLQFMIKSYKKINLSSPNSRQKLPENEKFNKLDLLKLNLPSSIHEKVLTYSSKPLSPYKELNEKFPLALEFMEQSLLKLKEYEKFEEKQILLRRKLGKGGISIKTQDIARESYFSI